MFYCESEAGSRKTKEPFAVFRLDIIASRY